MEGLAKGLHGRLEQSVARKVGELHPYFTHRIQMPGSTTWATRAPRADRALGGCCAPSRAYRDRRAEARLAR